MTTKKPATPSTRSAPYSTFFDILVALFLMGVGLALWYAGAYFTIAAFVTLGVPLHTLDGFEWLIPVSVSLLELRYWPGVKQTQVKTLALLLVGGFDLLSTAYGVLLWFPGRTIPLGLGYTMPSRGLALVLPVFVISLILTFGPERIVVWSANEIKRMWSAA